MKTTAVTGAAGVLGDAVAKTLVAAGHKVVAIDVAKSFPGEDYDLALSGIDLTDAAAVTSAFARIKEVGALTGLVNVAGGFRWETVADGDPSTWDLLWSMNVKTALHASRAALPLLKAQGGAIVNVSAAASAKAEAGMGAYTATKSGVSRLTEALAAEWKAQGVRVNAVMPSIIDTPTNRSDMPDADFAKWVRPQELASVIAFLLSDEASAITGALLPVAGRV